MKRSSGREKHEAAQFPTVTLLSAGAENFASIGAARKRDTRQQSVTAQISPGPQIFQHVMEEGIYSLWPMKPIEIWENACAGKVDKKARHTDIT